jgi:hypothetical protein
LRAVIGRILPHGGGWGGLSLGVDRFVARMLETDAALRWRRNSADVHCIHSQPDRSDMQHCTACDPIPLTPPPSTSPLHC